MSLEGDERLIRRLLELGGRARTEAALVVGDCTDHVKNRAAEGIASGPKTGRIYKRGGRTHRASRRGQYPATDTGNLLGSLWNTPASELAGGVDAGSMSLSDLIDAEEQITGEVGADAEYAVPLEYKPQTHGGRPFMRRAMDESRDYIRRAFLNLRGKFRP